MNLKGKKSKLLSCRCCVAYNETEEIIDSILDQEIKEGIVEFRSTVVDQGFDDEFEWDNYEDYLEYLDSWNDWEEYKESELRVSRQDSNPSRS